LKQSVDAAYSQRDMLVPARALFNPADNEKRCFDPSGGVLKAKRVRFANKITLRNFYISRNCLMKIGQIPYI